MATATPAPLAELADLPLLREPMGRLQPVTHDVFYVRTAIVNVFYVGAPDAGDGEWVLVDAGILGAAGHIRDQAARLFGRGSRPAAIVLTHGHFDHVGALRELAERWDVPVYAHSLEMPYLTGRSSYPPPDPTVGGGAMAVLSFLYPRGPIDLGGRVRPLPEDGSVPHLAGWRWVHTPGHTAGHVSLFRDEDGVLIAGDAFVTTDQESALAVLTQKLHVQGPPAYFTPDWAAAGESVRRLAELQPRIAATGHGIPLQGDGLRDSLDRLARNFDELAVPDHGRYVGSPAVTDETGVVFVPPVAANARNGWLLAAGGALVLGVLLASRDDRSRKHRRRRR